MASAENILFQLVNKCMEVVGFCVVRIVLMTLMSWSIEYMLMALAANIFAPIGKPFGKPYAVS
jgi:hypothetical protein